jgi:hypothetical protein
MKRITNIFSLLLVIASINAITIPSVPGLTVPEHSHSYMKQGYNGQCPIQDEEVCGINNITYQNECFLARAGVAKAYDGWCINGQNMQAPVQVNNTTTTGAPVTNPTSNPTQITVATGGSQLIITKWWRNPDNGYLTPGENYIGCPCNDSLLPVCGSNGMTYANMCRAECANVKAVKYGECGDYNYTWPGPRSCLCSFEVDTSNAVCGVNSRTYENKCVAACVNTPLKGGGFCDTNCNCGHYFLPVCGRDGATYDNSCKLDCKGVSKLHDGICSEASIDKCFFCEGNIKKVCGNDGITYDNECYMKCRGATRKSEGACPLAPGQACICPDVNLPVCGIDEQTYKNECEMNCKGVAKLGNKACYLYKREQNSCKNKCRDSAYSPVCGGNGQTYNNSCDAQCGGISVASNGPCGSAKNSSHCVCSDEPMPVCGVDGRDYLNKCAIECAGVSMAWEGPCQMSQNQSGALYKTGQISAGGAVNPGLRPNSFAMPVSSQPVQAVAPVPAPIPAPVPAPVQAPAPAPAASSLAPSMNEIKLMIDLALAKQQTQAPSIIVLPPLDQAQSSQDVNVKLQFVNPDGSKTVANNTNVVKQSLSQADFISNSSTHRVQLKMDNQMSLEQLYTLISMNPQSFYDYFTNMINKGAVSLKSIMFKGLTLGKLMDYIHSHFKIRTSNYVDVMVGSSKHS